MDKCKLAYLAGFIDADGSIYITIAKKTSDFRIKLNATNCNIKPLLLLKDEFGGSIDCKNGTDKWKKTYSWVVTCNKAYHAIKTLMPFLRIKVKQAELAVKLNELKKGKDLELLDSIKKDCQKLNQRGTNAAVKELVLGNNVLTKDDMFYSYLAGVVDADGSISIVSKSKDKQFVPQLTVYNCNSIPIELLVDNFGGKYRLKLTGKSKVKENWRPCYEWIAINKKAEEIIRNILPYLQIKKRQSILVLRLGKLRKKYNGGARRWDAALNEKCLRVYGKLKQKCILLNKRGN